MDRHLAVALHRALQRAPVAAVTGPRRSGKAALARREFPGLPFVTLDNAADRRRARQEPEAFLASLRYRAILDQVHRAPELLAALRQDRYLSGMAGLSQSNAALLLLAPIRLDLPGELHLYPPSLAERERRPAPSLIALARYPPPAGRPGEKLELGTGYRDEEALVRDVSTMIGLHDPDAFLRFVELAAEASGSIVDQSQWARACGVTHTTIARWLEALERAFRIVQPRAVGDGHGRRLVRRRKLFFLDPAWVPVGARFESWGVGEVVKGFAHTAQDVPLSHWATATGLATSLIAETSEGPVSISFTRLPTAPPAVVSAAAKWRAAAPHHAACIIVTGRPTSGPAGVAVLPWWRL